MKQSHARRYAGMTPFQWAVLGVLGLSLCCVLGGGLWVLNLMVARYSTSNLPASNFTPLPTLPLPTPTQTLTPTPTASPTPITYESLIPAGWKQFTAADPAMEIWLPASYAVQTEKDKKESIPVLSGEGNDAIRTVLLLKDTTPSSYLIFTTFEVDVRPVFADGLDDMIDSDLGAMMRLGRLLERDTFEFVIENYPARRLIFDINVGGTDAGLAVYVAQIGQDVWYLGFASPFNELYNRLPDFDKAVQTFRVTP